MPQVKAGIKVSLILSLFILFVHASCFAGEVKTELVNPVWEGILNDTRPSFESGGTFQSSEESVSSYDEFTLALIKAMRARQSNVTIYFEPSRSHDECKEWNDHFWGSASGATQSDIFQQIPWLYWAWHILDWQWSYDKHGFVTAILYHISYTYGPDEEKELEKGLVKTISEIVSPDMDMFTREKTIHDWIVNHVDYDTATLTGSDDLGYTDYSAFTRGLTVCEGYAVLSNRMFSMAGISNVIVSGNVKDRVEGHAWNIVNLCTHWYHVDVTWDDLGLYGDHTIRYKYFNVSAGQISADHSWDMNAYPLSEGTFDESICRGKIEPRCSIFELALCTTELECIRISGNWYDSSCHLDSQSNSVHSYCNAAPAHALPVVEFPTDVTPANHTAQVGACSDIMIKPTLTVPSADVGKTATLIMYIYLPDAGFGMNIPSKTKVLSSETKFDLLSKAIDFSDSAGLSLTIYYGYVIGPTIKYNAYSVMVGASCSN